MQTEKQQSWKIKIQARAKHFDFKLKATRMIPYWKFHRVCIFLRVHKFVFKLKSGSAASSFIMKRRNLRSKILSLYEKFPRKPTNPSLSVKKFLNIQPLETQFPKVRFTQLSWEEPICIASMIIGILSFLSKSIYPKDQTGFVIQSLMFWLCVALLLKKFVQRKTAIFLAIFMVTLLVLFIVFQSDRSINYDGRYVSELVWKAWNFAASSGCLFAISQASFWRVHQFVRRIAPA